MTPVLEGFASLFLHFLPVLLIECFFFPLASFFVGKNHILTHNITTTKGLRSP